jgi:hypothetical protein
VLAQAYARKRTSTTPLRNAPRQGPVENGLSRCDLKFHCGRLCKALNKKGGGADDQDLRSSNLKGIGEAKFKVRLPADELAELQAYNIMTSPASR